MTEPRSFVRYSNRKIHEIGEPKSYVTMGELLGLVASGAEISVVDDVTGDDLTAYIFSRLIYDRCRMDSTAYKAAELQRLIMSNPPPKTRRRQQPIKKAA